MGHPLSRVVCTSPAREETRSLHGDDDNAAARTRGDQGVENEGSCSLHPRRPPSVSIPLFDRVVAMIGQQESSLGHCRRCSSHRRRRHIHDIHPASDAPFYTSASELIGSALEYLGHSPPAAVFTFLAHALSSVLPSDARSITHPNLPQASSFFRAEYRSAKWTPDLPHHFGVRTYLQAPRPKDSPHLVGVPRTPPPPI